MEATYSPQAVQQLAAFKQALIAKNVSEDTAQKLSDSVAATTAQIFSVYVVAELGKTEADRIAKISDRDQHEKELEAAFEKKTGMTLAKKYDSLLGKYIQSILDTD